MKTAFAMFVSLVFATPLMAQAAAPVEAVKTANVWQILAGGGWMMIPLGILSVLTVMLILVFLFTLRRGTVVTARYMQTAEALIRKKDHLGLLAISNRHGEAVARIMQRTMDFLTKHPKASFSEARDIAQTEGVRQASALNQQVTYLADIGTIAPMLGLLGTVIGIVQSFGVIAIDAAATRPTMLASGIGQALIATATGLLVGIPAMMAYAYFRGRVQTMISELEGATTHLLALLSASEVSGGAANVKDLL